MLAPMDKTRSGQRCLPTWYATLAQYRAFFDPTLAHGCFCYLGMYRWYHHHDPSMHTRMQCHALVGWWYWIWSNYVNTPDEFTVSISIYIWIVITVSFRTANCLLTTCYCKSHCLVSRYLILSLGVHEYFHPIGWKPSEIEPYYGF